MGSYLSPSLMTLGVTGLAAIPAPTPWFDTILGWMLPTVIFLANLAGGIVVGVAVVRGLWMFAGNVLRPGDGEVPKEAIRISLGRSLALALEFQLAADVLGTALNPSINDVILLGAIIVLRTVLNFFLNRELREAERRTQEAQTAPAAAHVVRETQQS